MKVSVLTLGCKANQAESFLIESHLAASGHTVVDLNQKPELCIINTCSVTAKSDYQSRQLIRRSHRTGARVIVTGCYSELNHETVSSMEGVTRIIRNDEKVHIIEELTGTARVNSASLCLNRRSRFFLKVQDGCNYSCSYCIIPTARGRSRSLAIEEIVRQLEDVSPVFNEVVITGIHLGTYGYDLYPKSSLSVLLKSLLKTDLKRIRLSSLEITEVHEELLEIIQDEKVCKHLHIPLQSGDDRILGLMKRPYDSKRFKNGLEEIYKRIPDIAIGTDIIAGFPGEGEQEFANSERLVRSHPFAYLHAFPFSPRQGAVAATLQRQVPSEVKKARTNRLIELGREKKRLFMEKQNGRTLDLLVEERGEDGAITGTTGNYLKVKVQLPDALLKQIVNVRIVGHADEVLIGVPIESPKLPGK